MTDASTRALADSLEAQQFSLGREVERLRAIQSLVRGEPDLHAWRGFARSAFDGELTVLRRGVEAALAAAEEATASTRRAIESVLNRGG